MLVTPCPPKCHFDVKRTKISLEMPPNKKIQHFFVMGASSPCNGNQFLVYAGPFGYDGAAPPILDRTADDTPSPLLPPGAVYNK